MSRDRVDDMIQGAMSPDDCDKVYAKIKALQTERDRFRAVLEQYADESNWLNMCEDYHKGSYTLTEWNSTIHGAWEGPNLARNVLKAVYG